MAKSISIAIPIEQYRTDPSKPEWDLPPWGHPLGQGDHSLSVPEAGKLEKPKMMTIAETIILGDIGCSFDPSKPK